MPNKTVQTSPPVIVWFRRDLRLSDNLALKAALETDRPVILIYIRGNDDRYAGALGAAQGWWLHHSLEALARSVEKTGNTLLLLSGPAHSVIDRLIEETGADTVFWNRRYDPEGIAIDSAIKSTLRERGLTAQSFAGFLMHEPHRLLTGQGKRYSVYTPFWRAFESDYHPLDTLPFPDHIPPPGKIPRSESIDSWELLPRNPNWAKGFGNEWHPGEAGAHAALSDFLGEAIEGYDKKRDIPGIRATSRLSPHLTLGEISPHRIWQATSNKSDALPRDDVIRFRKELVWREFSWHLLFHTPDMPKVNLNRRFDGFPWLSSTSKLHAWQRGMTGYPIVDAGMRELWQTGWMHNRVRMIAASFLIKDLLIDWREGEAWFRDTLVDADAANNAASWQWVAGSGADAAPYFRIFNPAKQGETFDPDGNYVKTYCPELARLPIKYLHRPSDAPEKVLKDAGIVLGEIYPEPIVHHDAARKRALAAYKEISGASQD